LKKILIFSGYPHVIGGSQRQSLFLLKNISTEIYNIQLLTTQKGRLTSLVDEINRPFVVLPLPKKLDVFGKKILCLSILEKIFLIFPYLYYSFQIFKLLREEKIDIIQCMDERSVLLSGVGSFFTKTKVLWYLQTENSIGAFFWRLCIRFSDFIVYNGKYAGKYILEKKSSELIYTISSLKDEDIKCLKPIDWIINLKKQQNQVIIGLFSSVIPYKGYHNFFEAIAALDNKDNFTVIALGDFPSEYEVYQKWLLDKKEAYRIDNFTFVGWHQNPYQFMQHCDIVVLSSIDKSILDIGDEKLLIRGNEGLPTVVSEALQFSIPVITTNVGSTFEQVKHRKNGFIIKPNDTKALKEALEILIENADLRREYGKNGRIIFEQKFSQKNFSKRFETVYKQILKK
jgi:glycosyltransferase involved in cell wall biosynthesis